MAEEIPKNKSKMLGTKVEIKLDNLKASEIEKLLKNLYADKSKISSPASNSTFHKTTESKPSQESTKTSSKCLKRKIPENSINKSNIIEADLSNNVRKSGRISHKTQSKPEQSESESSSSDSDNSAEISEAGSDTTDSEYSDWDNPKPKRQKKSPLIKKASTSKIHKSKSTTDLEKPKRKPETYKCQICPLDFKNSERSVYLNHMRAKHADKQTNQLKCPHCPTTKFSMGSSLKYFTRHLASHLKTIRRREQEEIKIKDFLNRPCETCGKIGFTSELEMKEHKKIHLHEKQLADPTRKFGCPLCHMRFARRTHLRKHFFLHLENNPYICEFPGCMKKYSNDAKLRRHSELHTNRKFFPCEDCPLKLASEASLQTHIQKYHGNTPNNGKGRRSVSVVRVKSYSDLVAVKDETVRVDTGSVDLNEEDRDDISNPDIEEGIKRELETTENDIQNEPNKADTSRYKIKEEKHDSNDPFVSDSDPDYEEDDSDFDSNISDCDEINTSGATAPSGAWKIISSDPVFIKLLKTNPEAASLILPSRDCNPVKKATQRFSCPHCDWTGLKSYSLKHHIQNRHLEKLTDSVFTKPLVNKELICKDCGFKAKTKSELKKHGNEHRQRFYCKIGNCTQAFDSKERLQIHIAKHEMKVSCSKCGKMLMNEDKLEKHMRNQHDPKYKAQILAKSKCDICGKQLSTLSAMYTHKKAHRDDYRKQCGICGQFCAGATSLRRHVKLVHFKNAEQELQQAIIKKE